MMNISTVPAVSPNCVWK